MRRAAGGALAWHVDNLVLEEDHHGALGRQLRCGAVRGARGSPCRSTVTEGDRRTPRAGQERRAARREG